MLVARPYQARTIERLRASFASGARAPLVVAPTGAGKTSIAALAIAPHVARNAANRAVFVVPRLELAAQARATLARVGVAAGIVAGDAPADCIDEGAPVQIATVQTMVARGLFPSATLAVFDEAHHYVSPEWFSVLGHYRDRRTPIVGLTATPCRADGVALGEAFDALIVAASVRELTAAGHLTPCEVIAPPGRQSSLAEDPATAYLDHADGRRAIVFARDQAHAATVTAGFVARGIAAAYVDSSLSSAERRARIDAFRAGATRVLVNVAILTEGFDDPSVEVVILASGSSHAGSYLQKIGRALRPSPATGKTSALVIDLCGSVHDHGLPDDDRTYSLSGSAISGAGDLLALRQCPACGGVFRAEEFSAATCPRCGHVQPGRPDPKVERARLEAIRAGHSPERRADALRKLYETARATGRKLAWADYVFQARYKRRPTADERAAALQ